MESLTHWISENTLVQSTSWYLSSSLQVQSSDMKLKCIPGGHLNCTRRCSQPPGIYHLASRYNVQTWSWCAHVPGGTLTSGIYQPASRYFFRHEPEVHTWKHIQHLSIYQPSSDMKLRCIFAHLQLLLLALECTNHYNFKRKQTRVNVEVSKKLL